MSMSTRRGVLSPLGNALSAIHGLDHGVACQSAWKIDPPYCLTRGCYPTSRWDSRGGLLEGGRSPTDGSPPRVGEFLARPPGGSARDIRWAAIRHRWMGHN